MKRVALYARVSTDQQNTDLQLRELREYVERRGWEAIEFVDSGVSGAKQSRPELDKLMAAAKRKKIDAVLVWRFDRFARSVSHLTTAMNDFQNMGIDFISLTEGVDTSTANGRLIFHIFAALSEFERDLIKQRVRSGIAAAKARGVHMGRTQQYGHLEPEVRNMRSQGISWRVIAKELGIGPATAVRLGRVART